jgi:dolichol kinase
MTPGLLPFVLWVIPHADPLTPGWLLYLALNCVALTMAGCHWSRSFSRPGEQNCRCSSIAYSLLVLLAILLFPGQLEIGMAVFAIIAFGDGSATLGGLLLKGPTLPWNREKTWAGSLCFLLGGIPMAALYYWGEARPGVPWHVALVCAGTATVVSAFAESVSSRINDNIRVGITALLMMAVMDRYFLGWS